MKQLLLSALVLLALAGCAKKEEDTPAPTPATPTYVSTWTIGSTNYTSTQDSTYLSYLGPPNNVSLVTLNLRQKVHSSEIYTVNLTVPSVAGTYNLSNGYTNGTFTTALNGVKTTYYATTCNVTISTYTPTEVIGTFAFLATSYTSPAVTKTITSGKFTIKR